MKKEVSTSSIAISTFIFIVLNICPFFFLSVMIMNQENLGKDEIMEKIGTLYNGLRPIKSVVSHSFVFLIRRTVFVLLTFLLFTDPNIQVLLFIWLTLLYIVYVNCSQFYESSKAKGLETVNETSFCLIQYNLVLLNNLVERRVAIQCGNIIIALMSFLLILNMIAIVAVSFRAIKRKCYLRKLRK